MMKPRYAIGTMAAIISLVGVSFANQEKPNNVKIMVASFGTINSQAEVESWLADQLRPNNNISSSASLTAAEKLADPQLASEVMYVNWKDRRLEYVRNNEAILAENARRARVMMALKTHMLSDDALRYTQLGRDYLQSKISRKCGKLISVVDRGNMTIQQTEKQIAGNSPDSIAFADCVLSVVMGDREMDSKEIPIDNVGTIVKRTTYRQPYVGKIRDLSGNMILAFDGVAEIKKTQDNIVKSSTSDPARQLVESACEHIADEISGYFTTEVKFKIKVPDGMDKDDVEIYIDGREVDVEGTRVLSFDHKVKGVLDGCGEITKDVSIADGDGVKTVKMNFKKEVK